MARANATRANDIDTLDEGVDERMLSSKAHSIKGITGRMPGFKVHPLTEACIRLRVHAWMPR